MALTRPKAIVLGGEKPTSIGSVIADTLSQANWIVNQDNCWRQEHPVFNPDGEYDVPPMEDDEDAEALVVALGRTMGDQFDAALDTDIMDTIYGCLTLPLLAAKEYVSVRGDAGGRVVFIGSYNHDHPLSNGTAYSAAKAGLAMATKGLAWELSSSGFTFMCLHPHVVQGTPMSDGALQHAAELHNRTVQQEQKYAERNVQLPHKLTAQQVARMVHTFLMLPKETAEWLSGTGIDMYGGVR